VLRLLRLLRALKLQTHILEATVAERTASSSIRMPPSSLAQATDQSPTGRRAGAAALRSCRQRSPPNPVDGAARMIPATTMGGDFYDFIELSDGQIDWRSRMSPARACRRRFSWRCARTNLRDLAARHADPGACLAQTNELLCAQNPMDLFVTVFYCVFDPRTGVLRYANAGHNPPYVRRADGSIEMLGGAGGVALGVMPGGVFPDHTVRLLPGIACALYRRRDGGLQLGR